MSGFEYSTAAHMIYEGQEDAGLKVFQAIRDRYDGHKRNPFNEGEYGHRYARAMAAWAGILAYTGFRYSAVDHSMAFNPKDGEYFWSNGYQYGSATIKNQGNRKSLTLSALNGDLTLDRFILNGYGQIDFEEPRRVESGQAITFEVEKTASL